MSESLSNRLVDDLKIAMREGNTERRDLIRVLRSAIGNKQIDLQRDLTDDDVLGVIQTQIKQRVESADLYRNGGRDDLAEVEERQAAILREYLPEQMSDDEVEAIVREVADTLGLAGPGDMGKLMPAVLERVHGRAEGRTVSRIAREELSRRAADSGSADGT